MATETTPDKELAVKRENIDAYKSVYGPDAGKAVGKRKVSGPRKLSESEHSLPKSQRKYGARKGEKRLKLD